MLSPLAGSIHGLGLAAVTGSTICGTINYRLIPPRHIVFGYLIWAFVVSHAGMAFVHWLVERPQ